MRARTIVVPTDMSQQSLFAFAHAADIARQCGATVHLLHVLPPPGGSLECRQPLSDPDLDTVHQALGVVAACELGVSVVTAVRVGDPGEQIVAYARKVGADLIAIATHGRSGLARLLLGSTAEMVLRTAHCPVLSVRMPGRTEAPAASVVHVEVA